MGREARRPMVSGLEGEYALRAARKSRTGTTPLDTEAFGDGNVARRRQAGADPAEGVEYARARAELVLTGFELAFGAGQASEQTKRIGVVDDAGLVEPVTDSSGGVSRLDVDQDK